MMMGNMLVSKMVSNHQKLIFRGLGMCRYLYIRILLVFVFFKNYVSIFLDKLYDKKKQVKVLLFRINSVQYPKSFTKFSKSSAILALRATCIAF